MFRGSTKPGRDIELQVMEQLPGVAMFVEKPIATGPEEEIPQGLEIAKKMEDSKTICSVG